jgi:hypothetical protein
MIIDSHEAWCDAAARLEFGHADEPRARRARVQVVLNLPGLAPGLTGWQKPRLTLEWTWTCRQAFVVVLPTEHPLATSHPSHSVPSFWSTACWRAWASQLFPHSVPITHASPSRQLSGSTARATIALAWRSGDSSAPLRSLRALVRNEAQERAALDREGV